ncbi:MAG: BREX-1 system adenine-specific DNA-methyltransferase PglX [Lachnospiraceae bacterium]|nr:BREX-1 system adenine-specific DNA-methyltransferase PglX [Lachnospiraceae bacterium]
MDKTAIKTFAVWARRKLRSDMKTRAGFMGITEKGIAAPLPASTFEIQYFDVSSSEPVKIQGNEIQMRERIVAKLEQHAKESGYQTAYDSLIENMASVWFNRLIAIRYMEVNEYFPDQLRVLSSVSKGKQDPDLVSRPFDSDLEFTEAERRQVNEWLDTNKQDALFRFLLLKRCNQLAECLPGLFEEENDETEFFLRLSFVEKDGLVYHLVHDIDEEAWTDQVQIIGWLYQYYIAEKHDQIVNIYKGTVKKEDIPAATQLFTTDWVVRYMVDNSLGRYWIERQPESNLADKLEFFVKPKDGKITYISENVTPEEMTFLDDCMGSGHILIYAFEVLMEIYRERGYSDREAARSIVENNLFGLDIDDRCSQLAYFSVMMKARSYDRRFLDRRIRPHVYSIQESNSIVNYTNAAYLPDAQMNKIGEYLVEAFRHAKEIGSLRTVEAQDYDGYLDYLNYSKEQVEDDLEGYQWSITDAPKLESLARQAKVLSKKYITVCTNPPYLNKMEGHLKDFVVSEYKPYSGDLFSVFIYRNFGLCEQYGYSAFMTPFVWMFIKTYENLRKYIIDNKKITTLVQMEYSAFEEATVPICSFVLKNGKGEEPSLCFRLSDFKGGMDIQKKKVLEAIADPTCGYFYETVQSDLRKISGLPISYWLSSRSLDIFATGRSLNQISKPKTGMRTGDNDRFLRIWYEIERGKLGLLCHSADEAGKSGCKWFPYNKGGDFRLWYGNNALVVNWECNGEEIKENTRRVYPQLGDNLGWKITNERDYFKSGITWTALTSGKNSFRYSMHGFIFDSNKGPMLFGENNTIIILLGLLNSAVARYFLNAINPTLSLQNSDLEKMPILESIFERINTELIEENIEISKADWDSFETSWDYKQHPLVHYSKRLWDATSVAASMSYYYGGHPKVNSPLELCYMLWQGECQERFNKLKSNEEELNRIFIDIYGLQDELTPEVEDKDVTVRKADLGCDIRSFLSYAVGCMFGRYSLDTEGLAYAGGAWDVSKYTTFIPDEDNVIPITDQKYLPDDIVERLCEFLDAVYGEETREENLDFIAKALGGKGTSSRDVIRRYFLNDFFKDHCKIYQKRPIYWLFDSGRQNGFKALVYMHRWDKNSIGRVLVYLHKIQEKYEIEVRAIDALIEHMTDKRQEAVEERRKDHLLKQIAEIKEYDERLEHMTNEFIDIDLDDGVKVNYEKVQTDRNGMKYKILAPIK